MKYLYIFIIYFLSFPVSSAADHGAHLPGGSSRVSPHPLPRGQRDHGDHGDMLQGKWEGLLPVSGTHEALAISVDILFFDPNDYREYPQLSAIVKISLGGSGSFEYESEYYRMINYSYEKKELTLAQEDSDLVLRLTYQEHPQPHLEARVSSRVLRSEETVLLFRSKHGSLHNHHTSHHRQGKGDLPLVPEVSGDYFGHCAGSKTLLQISAAKGLTVEVPLPTTGLHHYMITAKLGYNDPDLCGFDHQKPTASNYCLYKYYNVGAYNFYEGHLLFTGNNGTLECHRKAGGRFSCQTIAAGRTESCSFTKKSPAPRESKVYPRAYHLEGTPEDLLPLPWIGDNDEELLQAAQGDYWGYMHHENRDLYQPMLLKTLTSRSTDNPHNLDQVFISANAQLYFGSDISQEFIPQSYDQRVFSNYPGLSFTGINADSILQVTSWTSGKISGVYYSKLFGRVGSFELLKRSMLPPLPLQAKAIPSIAGTFQSMQTPGNGHSLWQFTTAFPLQAQFSAKSYLSFLGGFRLQNAGMFYPWNRLERGSYDFYTGSFGIITAEGEGIQRIILGHSVSPREVAVFWPSAPRWGTVINHFEFRSLKKE